MTHISNETIDVRGNVLIMEGGHLWLENSTLIINGSQDGEFGLEVNRTGYLEAYDTEIQGSPGRYWIRCYNDTLLSGCSLHHIHGTPTGMGVTLFDGDITVRDSVIRDALWTCLAVYTDLTLLNVTFRDIQYRQMLVVNTLPSGSTTISVEDCTFDGHNSVSGRSSFGINVATYGGYEDIIMSVRNTHFEFLVSGMYIGCYDKLDLIVEDCTLVECWKGFEIRQSGSTVTLRRNVMRQANIHVTAGGTFDLYIEDNMIEQVETGVRFGAIWAGSYECSVENVTLRNCTNGISVAGSAGGGHIEITVRDCTLETVGTGFVAGQEVTISVHDTVHVPGSGRISGTGSSIKAYTTLDVREVVWRDGPAIEVGDLHLLDENGATVTVLDIGGLLPREVLGWQRTSTESVTRVFLYPALEIDEHWFEGVRYNIWSMDPTTLEIIDDVPPEVTIAYPLDGTGMNSSTLSARGGYTELGSGIAHLDVSIDGGPFCNITSFGDGRWNLTAPGLADGDHNLSLRGVDATGGVGNVSFVEFVIDTVPPVLDISPPPVLVNVTHVMLEGRVEPGSHLTIDGEWVPLSEDGSFSIGVHLDEGPNELSVLVTDWAGNTNRTVLHVVCDTVPPRLDVTSPDDASWVNTTWVDVRGVVEPGAFLTVMGDEVDTIGGAFVQRVELTEGERSIEVCATDLAGNRNSTIVVLFVDWTAPTINITMPVEDEFYTRDLQLWIYGQVDDPTIETITINGKVINLISGGFSKLCVLLEGANEFKLTVTDAADNSASTRLLVHRDLTPPIYEVSLTAVGGDILEVGNKLYSKTPIIQVHVTVDSLALIVHENGTVRSLDGEHRWRCELEEGRNVVRFDVEDQAGNSGGTFVEELFLDTTVPFIVIYEPPLNSTTKKGRILIHGATEERSVVRVGGTPVVVEADGEFRRFVDLVIGPNEIEVEVTDVVGNANGTVVHIERNRGSQGEAGLGTFWTIASIVFVLLVLVSLASYWVVHRRRRGPDPLGVEGSPSRPSEPPDERVPPTGEGEEKSSSDWEEY